MIRRDLLAAILIPIVAIAVAVLLVLANAGRTSGPPSSLPIASGTHFTIAINQQAGNVRWGAVTVHFTLSSVERLVGAWASDGPTYTGLASNGTPIFPVRDMNTTPGCSIVYNVTLFPGVWTLDFSIGGPVNATLPASANVTVTQTIQLVPPVGNAPPVAWWGGNATACP